MVSLITICIFIEIVKIKVYFTQSGLYKDEKWWNSFAVDKSAIFDVDVEKNVGNISISNFKKSDDWNP